MHLGIIVDGAGIGSAMVANKVPGVLAANCWNAASARNAREHNHANVLTLGSGHLDLAAAREVLAARSPRAVVSHFALSFGHPRGFTSRGTARRALTSTPTCSASHRGAC